MVYASRRHRCLLAAALGTLLAAGYSAACRAPTQITIEIFTDVRCSELRGTTITIGSLDDLETRSPEATTLACDDSGRIGSLVIVPRDARDGEIAIRVVSAFSVELAQCTPPAYGPGCIVARRALRFLPQASLYMPIRMTAVCNGIPCGTSETCSGGTCVSATIPDPSACEDARGCGEEVLALPPPREADAGADPGVPCGTDACPFVTPPDWQLVMFGTRSTPCPPGFTTRDVVRDPVAGPGACACGACTVAPLTCTAGLTLQSVQDNGDNCNTNTAALGSNAGACTSFPGSLLATTGFRPVKLTPACTSSAEGVSAAASTPARLCTPAPACAGAACQALPPGMRTCIERDGDVACPSSFVKTVLADSVTVSCPPCGCRVDVSCPGVVTFYDDAACTQSHVPINANGVCISAPGSVAAYRWTPGVMQLTNCVTSPMPATGVTAIGPRTVCCK